METVFERWQSRWLWWWRLRGLRPAERWVSGAVALTVVLCVLGYAWNKWDIARRKRALRAYVTEEASVLPTRPVALVQTMDDVILEAARRPWPGDFSAPELATPEARLELLGRTALFVRAALPEVSRIGAIGGAVRRSEKDAFVLCLRKPPASGAPADVREAATRYWMGGALFEDATHDVLPLHVVHKGLRPLSRAFAEELDEADDHLFVRRLEEEYELRMPSSLAMGRTAASVDLLIAVVDELPEGMVEPEVGKSLTATRRPAILPLIEDAPHDVRAVVWSASTRSVVLRIRTRVDARTVAGENAAMIAPHIQGCQAAMALRTAPLANAR